MCMYRRVRMWYRRREETARPNREAHAVLACGAPHELVEQLLLTIESSGTGKGPPGEESQRCI
ncbi:hypothetical protein WH47_06846 [Habropoda laboriosa]|uniref:Uncharacterized protein n=1 Tax=Habropoda laboriosa TaxID=597456 RepID=A0A0L7RJ84_9HYME|nr:hypothetical protein WH47_06846 [Habropoda laboriosa]